MEVPTILSGTYQKESLKKEVCAMLKSPIDPIERGDFEETGFCYTFSLISGKYKMIILYCLKEYETVRFNEMRRYLKHVSDKMLSSSLKELERDGLVLRTEYPQVPPKVEYSLTERGKSLVEVLKGLCAWGREHRNDDCCQIPQQPADENEKSE